MYTIILIVIGVLCFVSVGYYIYKVRKPKVVLPFSLPLIKDVNIKKISGLLSFQDMLAWFKNIKGLNKKTDIPFVANATFLSEYLNVEFTPNKKALLLGVYNEETDVIRNHVLIEADDFDEKIFEILNDEPLIVLN